MTALEKINFDVVGLSETHAKNEHQVRWTEGKLSGAEVFSSASSRGQNDSSIGGVGFIVHKKLCESIVAVDVSSSRIAVLKLKVPGQPPLKVIQVYAPHSGYSDDEREEFYTELEQKMAEPACRTIVMGDFNARIGRKADGERYVGQHSAEARNDAGARMAAFAEVKQLYVMNSYYEKPVEKRWTWQSADRRTRSEVDYVLCDDRLSVTNVEMLSRFEARSDHRIVRATVELNIPRMKKDRALANKKRIPKSVNEELLKKKLAEVNRWYEADQRINQRYERLEEQLMECVSAAEVRQKKDREPRTTAETRAMLQRLQTLKQSGDEPEECRRLSHEIRHKLKADYDEYRNRRLVEAAEGRKSLKKCKRRMAQTQLTTGALADEEGNLQTERPAVEEACRKFYTKLFDSKVCVERKSRDATAADDPMPEPVTAAEVEEVLKRFKNDKAPGPDGITAEMLKAGGATLWEQLAKFFTACMRRKRIPLRWKESRTVLLYKKGDPNDLKNYRPICLLPVIYKLFTKVIVNRIAEQLDAAQPPEQAGFRRGFCTLDHMQAVNQIQERAREKDMRLYLVFVDYEKAFDSIEINAVLNALESQGVSGHYVDILEDVYDGCSTEIKLFHDPVTIPIKRGVRQGDTISPKLFTAALEEVIKTLGWERRKQCGLNVNGRKLTHLRFADDIVLIGNARKEVERMLNELNRSSEAVGLRINRAKTKWMEYYSTPDHIMLDGEEIERVKKYVYLGQELSQDHQQGLSGEISRRIKAAWQSFNSIGDVLKKLTDARRRAQLFNSTVLPALLYGCQTWTLTNKQADRLRTTQRAMERRVLGITMWDCRRSEDIRAETQFRDAVAEATKLKIHWAGHVARRDDNRWTSETTKWNPKKKPRKGWGRPTRWDHLLIKKAGQNWMDMAQDRSQWRIQCTAMLSPRRMSRRVDEPASPED